MAAYNSQPVLHKELPKLHFKRQKCINLSIKIIILGAKNGPVGRNG